MAYLTGIGYSAIFAATAVSLFLIMTTAGLLGGPLADGFGARSATVVTFILSSRGMFALLGASRPFALATNILAGGLAAGALSVQMPALLDQLNA